ncbi:MAG: HlyD family efflux transporter periplasmic adaptor subunit [Treponema sp.]|nr:HlyD family efflux transporter periplasmic adaptor subunit [Treponema sp.]
MADLKRIKNRSIYSLTSPSYFIYIFLILVALFSVIILIWSNVAIMDDVIKASVMLRPSSTVSSVRCVTSGELYIKNYSNGDKVNQGDFLFSLDTTTFETELESYKLKQNKNDEDIFVYQILLSTIEKGKIDNIEKKSEAYLKSNSYLLEKSRQEKIVEDARIKYTREKNAPEGLRVQQNINDLENYYMQTKYSYETWINNQIIETKEKLSSFESEKKNIKTRITELERTIKNSKMYAPVSGCISESNKLNLGDYVLAGEEILRIVPENDKSLKADIYVDPLYVARVKIGDDVKIKFPGLAPSRYGMIETKVSLVPPDVTLTKNGDTVFIVEAVIESPFLYTKQGQYARLLPGINAEARIITDKSTVLQMILKKLDFLN